MFATEALPESPLKANAPNFSRKAGMNTLAVSYGNLCVGTSKPQLSFRVRSLRARITFPYGIARHKARLQEYESERTADLAKQLMKGFELTTAADADVSDRARAIVNVVDVPFGTRPVHVDPAHDGAEIVNGVADHARTDMLRNMGLGDLLRPSSIKVAVKKAFVTLRSPSNSGVRGVFGWGVDLEAGCSPIGGNPKVIETASRS
jgi:hypothetical protein